MNDTRPNEYDLQAALDAADVAARQQADAAIASNGTQPGGMNYVQIPIPPECEQYKNDIRRFVNAMVFKLAKNAHKGRWEDLTTSKAVGCLVTEVKELSAAINYQNSVEIFLEAADVANFAMIIASMEMEGQS